MIKYYAYYNHGGYKDFYIGSSEEEVMSKYFLPLLLVHENTLKTKPEDEELRKMVEHQRELPKMVVLSDQTAECNYPSQARIMMSHGGYKVLYRNLGCSQSVLAIRGISGSKDVYGRETPFNIMFVGNDRDDLKKMDILAEYIRNNLFSFESVVSSIFDNDIKENGLRCDVGKLREKLNDIIENGTPLSIDNGINPSVRMLVISNRSMLNSAIKEQSLNSREIGTCCTSEGTVLFSMSARTQTEYLETKQDSSIIRKREDTGQLWEYVKALETRIAELERRINHE